MKTLWFIAQLIFTTFFFSETVRAQIIKDQTIYESLKNELYRLIKAKIEFDTDFLFEHSIDNYSCRVDKKEFVKGLDIAKMMMAKSNFKITNTLVKEIGPIIFCGEEYQCLIKHEIISLRENNESSIKRYHICISKNGKDWYFQPLL